MRIFHVQAPLHCIESCTGAYYCPASLWEVGTYLLVKHHNDESLCETLQFQKQFLDSQQIRADNEEQKQLQSQKKEKRCNTALAPTDIPDLDVEMDPIGNKDLETTFNDDISTDVAFEKELNDWLEV